MFKTSVNFTVKMIIENVTKKEGDECKEWAVTEAVERGGGVWDQVWMLYLPVLLDLIF